MNWKTNWNIWGLVLAAACAFSAAQAGAVSEIAAEKLDFRLIPMVVDEKDIPPQDKGKYSRIELQREQPTEASEPETRTFLVSKKVYLTQEDVKDVRINVDESGFFAVNLEFTSEGAEKLKNFSRTFLNRQAVILDRKKGIYYISPFFRDVIAANRLQIGGGIATMRQAQEVAENIRKHIEFRGVGENEQDGDFESVTLKSLPSEQESIFLVWADTDKMITPKDMEKVLVRLVEPELDNEQEMLSRQLGINHAYYTVLLKMKPSGWMKLVDLKKAALVTKERKFVGFISYNGGGTLLLGAINSDEKEQFLRKITK